MRGTAIAQGEPLSELWVVAVIAPHFAAVLVARDVAPAAGMRAALEAPIALADARVHVAARIGAALHEGGDEHRAALVARADADVPGQERHGHHRLMPAPRSAIVALAGHVRHVGTGNQ